MFYNDEDGDSFKALDGLVLFWFKDVFAYMGFFFFLGQISALEEVVGKWI